MGGRLKGICDLIITPSPHLSDPSAFIFLSDPVSISPCHFSLCTAFFPHPSLNHSPSSRFLSVFCSSPSEDCELCRRRCCCWQEEIQHNRKRREKRSVPLKKIQHYLKLIRQLENGSEFALPIIISSYAEWGKSISSGSGKSRHTDPLISSSHNFTSTAPHLFVFPMKPKMFAYCALHVMSHNHGTNRCGLTKTVQSWLCSRTLYCCCIIL